LKLITGIVNCQPYDKERLDEIFKSFDSKKVLITVEKYNEKRTNDQNKGLWRWNRILGDHTGYTDQEMHYTMCGELYGWKELNVCGKVMPYPNKTTSTMSTSEFSHHIMLYKIKALELFGIDLPSFSYEETT
jgi:hypothetical protein